MLFKILVDGKSCNGGDAKYPDPGEWTETREPCCCNSGWHLTSDPLRWWMPRATLWLAEGETPLHGDGSDKAAFARVRLLEQITTDWPYLVMFPRIRAFLAATRRSLNPDCYLGWANLSGSDLSGAYLSGANLSGSDLLEAVWPQATEPPNGWVCVDGRLKRPETMPDAND